MTSAPVSGWLMNTDRPLYWSDATPFSTMPSSVTLSDARPGSVNPLSRAPPDPNTCTRSSARGRSATTNVPFGATENPVGSRTRPVSCPICTIFQAVVRSRSMP